MEKAEKKYKAVVVVVVKKLQGVFVATCGGVDWTSRPSYLWKKLVQNALLPEPGGGAGTGVFSLQTNPTKNKINPTINLSVLVHQTTRQPTENTKSELLGGSSF